MSQAELDTVAGRLEMAASFAPGYAAALVNLAGEMRLDGPDEPWVVLFAQTLTGGAVDA
jgi:hypothetical protein